MLHIILKVAEKISLSLVGIFPIYDRGCGLHTNILWAASLRPLVFNDNHWNPKNGVQMWQLRQTREYLQITLLQKHLKNRKKWKPLHSCDMADSCKEGFVLPKGLKVNKLSFMVKHETEQTKSERGRCLRKLIPWSLSKLFYQETTTTTSNQV